MCCTVLNPFSCLGWTVCTLGLWPCIFYGQIGAASEFKGKPIYYFKDNIVGPLKPYICQALRVSSIKQAGLLWERNFITPVSQLLIEHSEEMKQDAVTLQILLNLYRCYHRCDFIAARGMDWSDRKVFLDSSAKLKNFSDVYQRFYDSLVDALLSCNEAGEMENILCGLLLKEDGQTKIGNKYYKGTWEYGIVIEHLVDIMTEQLAVSQKATTSQSITNAFQVALKNVQEIKAEVQRSHEQNIADQMEFAANQMNYAARHMN